MEHHRTKLEHFLVRTKKRSAGSIGDTIDSKDPTHTSRSACTPQFLSQLKRLALLWTTGSVDLPGYCSATLQSPSRWLPRAVVIGLASYGRAYWHRAAQARIPEPSSRY